MLRECCVSVACCSYPCAPTTPGKAEQLHSQSPVNATATINGKCHSCLKTGSLLKSEGTSVINKKKEERSTVELKQ